MLPAFSQLCVHVRRQKLEPVMKQQTGSKLGEGYIKAVYCHPPYLTYMQRISCRMPVWIKQKLESRLLGEISITLDIQMTLPYGRTQRGTKEPLDESERGVWRSWLKTQLSNYKDHGIQSPITYWQTDGGKNGSSEILYFEVQFSYSVVSDSVSPWT